MCRHEAGVYLSSTDSIYVASQATSLENPINITVIDAKTYKATSEVRYAGQVLPNGGTAYNSVRGSGAFSRQGIPILQLAHRHTSSSATLAT